MAERPGSCDPGLPSKTQGATVLTHSPGAPSTDPPARESSSRRSPRRRSASQDPLLPRVARGEQDAVQQCMDRYAPLVWNLARQSIPDRSLAEDAVQEIFIELWRIAGRYDPDRSSEPAFIATITRRRLIDRYRRRAFRPDPEPIDDLPLASEEDQFERIEICDEARLAKEAMSRLRPEQKRLLELWILKGLSHSEIATSTGLPLGTVKSHLRRGIARVRALLAADRSDDLSGALPGATG